MKRLLPTLMLICICGLARAEFASAMRAIERGHYGTAERALRQPAVKGDARAQNNLGYLYEHGLGVAQNYGEALQWYRRASDAGLPEAKYNLGTLYHYGRGLSRNHEAALPLFISAAQAGYPDAEYMLAEYHRSGLGGLARDGAVALSWFLRAARKGHSGAQLMAASIYFSGEGWRSEPQKALIWAELARINGEFQAGPLADRAGKILRGEQLREAMQQASLCLKSSYKDCPE
jgi:TPR repeat protein